MIYISANLSIDTLLGHIGGHKCFGYNGYFGEVVLARNMFNWKNIKINLKTNFLYIFRYFPLWTDGHSSICKIKSPNFCWSIQIYRHSPGQSSELIFQTFGNPEHHSNHSGPYNDLFFKIGHYKKSFNQIKTQKLYCLGYFLANHSWSPTIFNSQFVLSEIRRKSNLR